MSAYQALELRDYGRVDMRLKPDGTVTVIEVNPNPWLASRAELAQAARKAGRTYYAARRRDRRHGHGEILAMNRDHHVLWEATGPRGRPPRA